MLFYRKYKERRKSKETGNERERERGEKRERESSLREIIRKGKCEKKL